MAVLNIVYLTLYVSLFSLIYCQVREIIPEQAGMTYVNTKFIKDCTFKVFRYGRKSSYQAEIVCTILHRWENNITAHFVFFESFGSTYKRSFVEFKGRLCDLFNDSLLSTLLTDTGYTCPVPPGEKYMRNMTLNRTLKNLGSVKWPFKKAKVEGTVSQTYTKDILAIGSIVLNFK